MAMSTRETGEFLLILCLADCRDNEGDVTDVIRHVLGLSDRMAEALIKGVEYTDPIITSSYDEDTIFDVAKLFEEVGAEVYIEREPNPDYVGKRKWYYLWLFR